MESTIKTALKKAGKMLMNDFGKVKTCDIKENQSNIVTQTDINSEMTIIKIIEDKFPNHNIITEEAGYKNKNSNYTWIIDPLDGTSNFSVGIPWFGIMICVLKDNEAVMAGIYLPFDDSLYFAEKGKGATKNGNKIQVSKENELKNILMAYSLDYSEDPSKIIKKLVQNVRNLRSTNSIIDLCYIADGRFGGCIHQSLKMWDIAASYLIIKEAGGIVTDINGNDINFNVNKSDYQKDFTMISSNNILHKEILKLISEIIN